MLENAWSDTPSDVTEELGRAISPGDEGAAVTLNRLRFRQDFPNEDAAPRQRGLMPKVQPSVLNRSDQRVPVYWDQTVPVWEGGGGAASNTKRKASASHGRGLQDRDESRRFQGAASSSKTASLENSGENCACSGRDEGSRRSDDDGRARNSSSEVSFDAILSMYESSLVENPFKWSRREGWVFGSTLLKPGHDPTRRRLWPRRSFAGRRLISVQLSAYRTIMGEAGVDHDEVGSVRRLRVAIERTTICDPPSATCNSSHCGRRSVRLRNADPILHGRRRSCDFRSHHHHRDPLNFRAPMLTSNSS